MRRTLPSRHAVTLLLIAAIAAVSLITGSAIWLLLIPGALLDLSGERPTRANSRAASRREPSCQHPTHAWPPRRR